MKKVLYILVAFVLVLGVGFGIVFVGFQNQKQDLKITDEMVRGYEKGLNEDLKEFQKGFNQSQNKGGLFVKDFTCKADKSNIVCVSKNPKIADYNDNDILLASEVVVKTDILYLGDKKGKIPTLEAYKNITKDGAKTLNIHVKNIHLSGKIQALAALANLNKELKDYAYLISFAGDKYDFVFDWKISSDDDTHFDLYTGVKNISKNISFFNHAKAHAKDEFYTLMDEYGRGYDTTKNTIYFKKLNEINSMEMVFNNLFFENIKFVFTTDDIKNLATIINKHKRDLLAFATSENERKVLAFFVDTLLEDGKFELEFYNDKGLSFVDFANSFKENPNKYLKTKLNGKEFKFFN